MLQVSVSIYNYQLYRHIERPGWRLGWTWPNDEVIWDMRGAETTNQGNCSKFKGDNIPHCCEKSPTIVDLLPGTPYNMQTKNCCRGGVLSSLAQDRTLAMASFQMSMESANISSPATGKPSNFTLGIPGYTCSNATVVAPSKFQFDKQRTTQALSESGACLFQFPLHWSVQRTFIRRFFYCFWWRNDFAVTWEITCSFSQFRESETPSCCVSLSTFYNSTIVSCPRCSCGCQGEPTLPTCSRQASPFPPWIFSETHHLCSRCCRDGEQSNFLQLPNGDGGSTTSPAVLCTPHMCPIRVHWHVKESYREYWRVKVTITNFNMYSNYSDWNLVIQHPNFRSILQIFSFNYLPLVQYGEISECSPLRSSIAAWRCSWSPDVLLLQMIPRCFGASSITMTCWFSAARTGMCRPRCCCTKTLQTLPSVEAGLSRGGYRSMDMIVSCRRRIRTRRCPTEAPRCPLWFIVSPWFSRRSCCL